MGRVLVAVNVGAQDVVSTPETVSKLLHSVNEQPAFIGTLSSVQG